MMPVDVPRIPSTAAAVPLSLMTFAAACGYPNTYILCDLTPEYIKYSQFW